MRHAARISDPHTCPASSPMPHGGGLIVGPGETTVHIGYAPAATASTPCLCASVLPNSIAGGSSTVHVGYKPAARVGDSTAHGGKITAGCPTVVIGG